MATSITGSAASKAKKALAELKKKWESEGNVGNFVPKTGTKEDYDKLVKAVEIAAKKNENVAALRERIGKLGASVVNLAKFLEVI